MNLKSYSEVQLEYLYHGRVLITVMQPNNPTLTNNPDFNIGQQDQAYVANC